MPLRRMSACLFNVTLLGLPLYLESQAYAVLEDAERYKGHDESQKSSAVSLPVGQATVTYVEAHSPGSSHRAYSVPESAVVLSHTWSGYVERREKEWNFFFLPISIAFVSNAPSIFQFPGANDDTFTRSFTSLATSRAMSSLFYMVFFHVYVRDRVKDRRFIMEYLYPKKTGSRMILSPWMILSFPAAATGWTVLLYMCAINCFILGGEGPVTSPTVKSRRSLVAIVFVGVLVDILCMVWIGTSLSGYGNISGEGERTKALMNRSQGGPVNDSDKGCGMVQV